MGDFFLTLPSNVSKTDKTNKYCVNLPKRIQLDGKWEVALVEIQYPFSWNNISGLIQPDGTTDNWIDVTFANGYQTTLFVPPGFYPTVEKLIDAINYGKEKLSKSLAKTLEEWEGVKKQNPEVYAKWFSMKEGLKYNHQHDIFKFGFVYQETLKRVQYKSIPGKIQSVQLSERLQYMLGFDIAHLKNKTYAKYIPDMKNGFYSLYIYCDVVEPQIVGDSIVNLLRTVHISGKHEDIVERLYHTPHYVPVNKKEIDRVSIEIKDDRDQLVPFDFGKVVVKLHFRKKRLL